MDNRRRGLVQEINTLYYLVSQLHQKKIWWIAHTGDCEPRKLATPQKLVGYDKCSCISMWRGTALLYKTSNKDPLDMYSITNKNSFVLSSKCSQKSKTGLQTPLICRHAYSIGVHWGRDSGYKPINGPENRYANTSTLLGMTRFAGWASRQRTI